jgi:hypothetical protein
MKKKSDEFDARLIVDSRSVHIITFRDVEECMSTFSGDKNINVQSSLLEFEEMYDLCGWSDVQRVINAKRLLCGSAKLFVDYEKCLKAGKQ